MLSLAGPFRARVPNAAAERYNAAEGPPTVVKLLAWRDSRCQLRTSASQTTVSARC